jgi:hypothetical protein
MDPRPPAARSADGRVAHLVTSPLSMGAPLSLLLAKWVNGCLQTTSPVTKPTILTSVPIRNTVGCFICRQMSSFGPRFLAAFLLLVAVLPSATQEPSFPDSRISDKRPDKYAADWVLVRFRHSAKFARVSAAHGGWPIRALNLRCATPTTGAPHKPLLLVWESTKVVAGRVPPPFVPDCGTTGWARKDQNQNP